MHSHKRFLHCVSKKVTLFIFISLSDFVNFSLAHDPRNLQHYFKKHFNKVSNIVARQCPQTIFVTGVETNQHKFGLKQKWGKGIKNLPIYSNKITFTVNIKNAYSTEIV